MRKTKNRKPRERHDQNDEKYVRFLKMYYYRCLDNKNCIQEKTDTDTVLTEAEALLICQNFK